MPRYDPRLIEQLVAVEVLAKICGDTWVGGMATRIRLLDDPTLFAPGDIYKWCRSQIHRMGLDTTS